MYYDLHSHTYYSDGTLSPTELVQRAHTNGVKVLALTDHDVTHGLAEATTAAVGLGLTLIPGAEISVTWEGQTLHIVALNIDPENRVLQAGLANLRDARVARAQEIGRKLEKKGIANAYAGAQAYARGAIISRTHFVHFLVDNGHARDLKQVFKAFLNKGGFGYAPGHWASLEEAVCWIKGAGGCAVIAHPARYKLGAAKLRRLLNEFKEIGGVGLEVVAGSHSPDDCFRFARLTQEFGFFASVGSDYHGPIHAWTDLGRLLPLPDGCRPIWQAWEGATSIYPN